MGKSLRSHTKKKFKAIKRATVFGPVEDARLARLAKLQADAAKKDKVGDYMDDDKETTTTNDAMTEAEPNGKVSTSGPRSKRHAKKLKEKKKPGKKTILKF
ncbi:hypothetical protein K501DRAFT_169276 [Backusella circina FSU 941]|nr:hypothetical protein K501DRAFT_169276 [Backusella circina FSU 941]